MTIVRTVNAIRYVTPLREGGSLPAVVEADDDGTYVVKFRGAGQGPKALIAELIAGEIGRGLGLPVPEIVIIEFDSALAKAEPDPEIQHLLNASAGLNVALDFLPGSLAYIAGTAPKIDPDLAAAVVWFDAFVMNVDRTPRNPNLLLWHRKLWLIDHGAALYPHHTWLDWHARAGSPFSQIRDHILLPVAGSIGAANERLSPLIDDQTIREIVALVPESWLEPSDPFHSTDELRDAYVAFLTERRDAAAIFVEEAERVRAQRV
jgi:hypothetical protein